MRTINYTKPEPRIFVDYQGRRMALLDVARLVGVEVRTLRARYRAGERGERLWRPLDFQQRHHGKPAKPISEREQRRLELVARIRAAHAAEIAKPLIDARLVSNVERKEIRARIKHARRWDDTTQEAIT